MSTNKSKLVNWDADFYKLLPDEYCLYCLSKKQVYVLGQALQHVHWSTRWFGDTSGLDYSEIAGELEGILGMDECGNFDELMDIIIGIRNDVNILIGVTENPNTDIPYNPETSTLYETQYQDTLTEPLQSSPCATNADRDILYGGVIGLSDYLVNNVIDFLQKMEQSIANPPELVENLTEAIPGFGLLPFDDAVEYAGWLIDQLLESYEAIITDDLIQDFRCELFCLAIDHNCTLTAELILELINSKLPHEFSDVFKNSLQQAISFIVTGDFIGDDYFYIMIGLQLNIILMGQQWLRARGWKPYQYRFAAGKLEPNNGHEVFCTECPTYNSYIEFDFQTGVHGWVFTSGSFDGSKVTGDAIIGTFDTSLLGAEKPLIFAYAYDIARTSHTSGHGTNETTAWSLNTSADPDTFSIVDSFFQPNGRQQRGGMHISANGNSANQIGIELRAVGDTERQMDLYKFRIYLKPDSPIKGLPVSKVPTTTEFTTFTFWSVP